MQGAPVCSFHPSLHPLRLISGPRDLRVTHLEAGGRRDSAWAEPVKVGRLPHPDMGATAYNSPGLFCPRWSAFQTQCHLPLDVHQAVAAVTCPPGAKLFASALPPQLPDSPQGLLISVKGLSC